MFFRGFIDEFPNYSASYYSEGSCHEFAIAMARIFGYHFVVVTTSDEIGGYDEDGCDIPCVVHVMAHDPKTDMVHDVFGSCADDNKVAYIHDKFHNLCVDIDGSDYLRSESELLYFIDSNEQSDRPLSSFSNQDLIDAAKIILANSYVSSDELGVKRPFSKSEIDRIIDERFREKEVGIETRPPVLKTAPSP